LGGASAGRGALRQAVLGKTRARRRHRFGETRSLRPVPGPAWSCGVLAVGRATGCGHRGVFPSYAISADGTPSPAMPEILRWLNYPSGMLTAIWFEGSSMFLNGARPRELIMSAPDRVIAAANDSSSSDTWSSSAHFPRSRPA
jgi:hypothetical protein